MSRCARGPIWKMGRRSRWATGSPARNPLTWEHRGGQRTTSAPKSALRATASPRSRLYSRARHRHRHVLAIGGCSSWTPTAGPQRHGGLCARTGSREASFRRTARGGLEREYSGRALRRRPPTAGGQAGQHHRYRDDSMDRRVNGTPRARGGGIATTASSARAGRLVTAFGGSFNAT